MASDDDYFEPPWHGWDDAAWNDLVQRGGAICTFCDELANDRRYLCAVQIHRAFSLSAGEMRYAHVECLRKAMHPHHKLN